MITNLKFWGREALPTPTEELRRVLSQRHIQRACLDLTAYGARALAVFEQFEHCLCYSINKLLYDK